MSENTQSELDTQIINGLPVRSLIFIGDTVVFYKLGEQ